MRNENQIANAILSTILKGDYIIWSRHEYRHLHWKHTYIDFGDDTRVNCFSRNRISRHSNYLWFQFPIKGFYFTFNLIPRFLNHVASAFPFLSYLCELTFYRPNFVFYLFHNFFLDSKIKDRYVFKIIFRYIIKLINSA